MNIYYRNITLILFLLFILPQVSAIKIAAGPQEIILEGSSGKFSVFNPNDLDVDFSVEGSEGLFFNQTDGIIIANSKIDIGLKAYEEGSVLIKFLNNDIEPGVQIKVKKPDIPNYGVWIFFGILLMGLVLVGATFSTHYIRAKA